MLVNSVFHMLTSSHESTKASASVSNGVSEQSGIFFSWDCNCLHTDLNSSILGPRQLRFSFMPTTYNIQTETLLEIETFEIK